MTYSNRYIQELLHGDVEGRAELAQHGYALETLLYDESWVVRFEVAKQCYGLDVLANDENESLKGIAEMLKGAKRHLVETNFGTYNGELLLFTWEDRYLIESGCYVTDDVFKWAARCTERMGIAVALTYIPIIKYILEEEM